MPDSLAARRWRAPGSEPYARISAAAADGLRTTGAFDEPEQWRFDWERSCTRDEWLDQLPTTGAHTQLPPDRLEEVMAGIGAAVDAVGGGFTMRCTAVVVTATRTRTRLPHR